MGPVPGSIYIKQPKEKDSLAEEVMNFHEGVFSLRISFGPPY